MKPPVEYLFPAVKAGEVPFWRLVLRGCSQLCFQTNELTGILFLIAAAVASPLAATYMLVAAILAPLGGLLLREKRSVLEQGLYGFNPCLMALALPFFYHTSWTDGAMWGVLVVTVICTIVLTRIVVAFVPFPTMAVPFLVTFWCLNALAPHVAYANLIVMPPAQRVPVNFPMSVFMGLGETVFSLSVFSGAIYLLGVVTSNWRHGLLALLGSMIGVVVAYYHAAAGSDINIGFFGFNGVLTAVSVYVLCGGSFRLSILGAILATMLMAVIPFFDVITVSAPFVLATWLIMALGWFEKTYMRAPVPAAAAAAS